jgi:hypothetical protein
MKKEFLLIKEKRQTLNIRIERKKPSTEGFCKTCGNWREWMSIDEASMLFGGNPNLIREELEVLRSKQNESDS